MKVILDGLKSFGRMLGVTSVDKSEALLHSEAGARSLLSRRAFIGASAALAATAVAYSYAPARIFVGRPGYLYMSLHTADPGEFQAEEATYAGYSRVEVSRTSESWEVSQGVANNAQAIEFPVATGGSETVSYLSFSDHRGRALISGPLRHPVHVSNGCKLMVEDRGITLDPFGDNVNARLGAGYREQLEARSTLPETPSELFVDEPSSTKSVEQVEMELKLDEGDGNTG